MLRDPRRSLPEALLLLAPLVTVAVFWYSPRYRLPALPLLAMLAAQAAFRSPRERAGAAVALLLSIGTGAWNRHAGFDALSSYRGQYELAVGGALVEQEKLSDAEARFRAARAAGDGSALSALADVLRREGRSDEALELLRSAIREQPGSAYAHRSLAVALAEARELPEAEREFRAAISIDPNDWEALSGLGNVLHAGGREDEAIAAHRSSIAVNPAFAAGHYNLGCVLFASRKYAEAEIEFRESLRLDPRLIQAQWYLDQIRNGRP
jgi:tetratricopeptide (TPR) repeat protein